MVAAESQPVLSLGIPHGIPETAEGACLQSVIHMCTVASENSLKNTKVAIIYFIVIPDMYWVHQGSKFVVANTSNGSKCYHVFSFATGMLM